QRFNAKGEDGQPWSLISRLRQDADLLSPKGRQMLGHFGSEMSALFGEALAMAQRHGELADNVRAEDAALLLAAVADNAAPITLTEGGFDKLATIYKSLGRIIEKP